MTLEDIKQNCTIDLNGCWNWNKTKLDTGYGQIFYNGKYYLTHRVVYSLYHEINFLPINIIIRHDCNNKRCCNPEHLDAGSQSDNILDQYKAGRAKCNNNANLAAQTRNCESIKELVKFYLSLASYNENNCLLVTCKSISNGYVKVSYKKRAYTLAKLILADKLNKNYDTLDTCRHICHNKSCINPDHLIEGTRSDNIKDNREISKTVKLKVDNVKEIRSDMKNWDFSIHGNKTKFDKKWAIHFAVSHITINNVRTSKTWSDITVIN